MKKERRKGNAYKEGGGIVERAKGVYVVEWKWAAKGARLFIITWRAILGQERAMYLISWQSIGILELFFGYFDLMCNNGSGA